MHQNMFWCVLFTKHFKLTILKNTIYNTLFFGIGFFLLSLLYQLFTNNLSIEKGDLISVSITSILATLTWGVVLYFKNKK